MSLVHIFNSFPQRMHWYILSNMCMLYKLAFADPEGRGDDQEPPPPRKSRHHQMPSLPTSETL